MRAKAGKTALGPIRRGPAPPPPEAIPERLSGRFRSRQLNQLTARDLMMPGVTTIVEEASLENGLRAMVAHRTHAILVTGARTGRPLGWATDRGLLAHLERDAPLTFIRDAITEEAVSVTPGAAAREVVTMLSHTATTHVLVASGAGRTPEGVISAFDLIRSAAW